MITGMSTSRWLSEPEQEIWLDCLSIVALARDRLNLALRPFDLDINEYEVLVVLSESEGFEIRMSALAQGAHQSRSRLTHTVNRLEADGLIKRRNAPDDRRGVIAQLTNDGVDVVNQASPAVVGVLRELLIDPVDKDDLAALGRAVRSMLNVANSTV